MINLEDLLFKEITKNRDDILLNLKKRDSNKVVTRIAPSPTWFFHIWTLYTTMVDEIFAHKNNWILFLRSEDTDQKREIKWAMKKYIDILNIFKIRFDEWPIWKNYEDVWDYWPYTQSQREEIYKIFIKDLIKKNLAYPCFLTQEEIDEIRNVQEASKLPTWIYDNYSPWRNASFDDVKKALEEKKEFVIRFKSPWSFAKKIEVIDEIKWKVSIAENFLDIVIMKVWGLPTYHFAHIVDDYLMQTTLVIRWDEWFASLPLHLQLFESMWWKAPKYAHISPLVKLDWDSKRKLSKRKDDEANIEYYLENWFLPKAILDFLYNMINAWFEDWRALNQDKSYLEYNFELEKMPKAWALVDLDKLKWVNSNIIKNMDFSKIFDTLSKYLEKYELDFYQNTFLKNDLDYNKKILKELQTRLVTLKEYKELTTFFYNDFEVNDKVKNLLINPKMKIEDIDTVKKGLNLTLEILKNTKKDFENIEEIKNIFIEEIKKNNLKNGQVLWPVRVALSWEEFSPWALELIFILWVEKSRDKVKKLLDVL